MKLFQGFYAFCPLGTHKEEVEGDKYDIKCQQKNRYTELLFRVVF